MSTKVCVGSTIKDVTNICTFIEGQRRDIASAWTFVNGKIKQVWPNEEVWTLIAEYSGGQEFSLDLTFGKYRFDYSAGGGGGASFALRSSSGFTWTNVSNGQAGTLLTREQIVPHNQTKRCTGKVGTGGKGSSTYARSSAHGLSQGAVGTGYHNGFTGSIPINQDGIVATGGSGGGSTIVNIDGYSIGEASGGNGGTWIINGGTFYGTKTATGGSGGVTTEGTERNNLGAAGGSNTYGIGTNSGNTSGNGSDGYVKIYKSNLYY